MKKLSILFTLLIVFTSSAQEEAQLKRQVRQTIKELRDFVAIPNDALENADINRNLSWLTKNFNARGFNSSVLPTDGESLFFAALPMEDQKPTILFYMHFDGQSVDQNKWNQPDPYKMVLKHKVGDAWKTLPIDTLNSSLDYNMRLFGRSTADDKGPIVMFLNTIDLLKENNVVLPFNVKIILDSEEEKSSKPLPKAVKEYKELLQADFLIVNDGPLHTSQKPTIIYGCRGITSISLTAFGPEKSLHSGHYGNYAPNPAFILSKALASMKGDDGKVTIPGFYDGITLDENTQAILKNVPDDALILNHTLGIKTPEKIGAFYQEALQYPSLNIRGLGSGWIGEKARTIIPATATAEIDIRLVPETDGDRLKSLVKTHLEKQGFFLTTEIPNTETRLAHDKIMMFSEGSVIKAFRTDINDSYGAFLVKTLSTTFGEDPVQIRTMGGTVPIAPFVYELKIPAFIVPMVQPDNNQHNPNENLKIGQIAYGIKTFYAILSSSL